MAFYVEYNDSPKEKGKRTNEKKLGRWIASRRQEKQHGNLDKDLEEKLHLLFHGCHGKLFDIQTYTFFI